MPEERRRLLGRRRYRRRYQCQYCSRTPCNSINYIYKLRTQAHHTGVQQRDFFNGSVLGKVHCRQRPRQSSSRALHFAFIRLELQLQQLCFAFALLLLLLSNDCFCLIYWLDCGNLFAKRLKLQLRTHFLKIWLPNFTQFSGSFQFQFQFEFQSQFLWLAANIYETNITRAGGTKDLHCCATREREGWGVCEKESVVGAAFADIRTHAKWVTWKDQLSHLKRDTVGVITVDTRIKDMRLKMSIPFRTASECYKIPS